MPDKDHELLDQFTNLSGVLSLPTAPPLSPSPKRPSLSYPRSHLRFSFAVDKPSTNESLIYIISAVWTGCMPLCESATWAACICDGARIPVHVSRDRGVFGMVWVVINNVPR